MNRGINLPTPLRLAASLALTGAIVFLSLVPGYPQEDDAQLLLIVASVPSLLQNTMHFVLYGLLTLFWALTLARFQRFKRPVFWAAVLASGIGIALEYGQLFVPGRYASLMDIGLNTGGVIIGVVLAKTLRLHPLRYPH